MRRFKVLFISNYPSPYRVDFFNLFGKYVDLTVAFTERIEAQKHRSSKWFNEDYSGFNAVFLKNKIKIGRFIYFSDIIPLLKSHFDHIILGGYTSMTQMIAIEYMRIHKIPFTIEADGGLISNESKLRFLIKRHFIGSADSWLSSGKVTTSYFIHYGAKREKVYLYPFTSQWKKDLDEAGAMSAEEKCKLRDKLSVAESNMVISVGRFSYKGGYGKGYDTLCDAAKLLNDNTGIYIIGDEPTEEFIRLKSNNNLTNVHFVGFKAKDELAEYYAAADLFVLLTRNDVWGLVINEAMSFGLPIITTDVCGAGLSLIENNINGFIIPAEDAQLVAEKISYILENPDVKNHMAQANQKKIQSYTIENMVDSHNAFLSGGGGVHT